MTFSVLIPKPRIDFLIIVSDCDAVWGNYIPKFPVIVVKVGNCQGEPPSWVKKTIKVTRENY